eukprot:6852699-Prymnesium_polylepis.1
MGQVGRDEHAHAVRQRLELIAESAAQPEQLVCHGRAALDVPARRHRPRDHSRARPLDVAVDEGQWDHLTPPQRDGLAICKRHEPGDVASGALRGERARRILRLETNGNEGTRPRVRFYSGAR